VNGQGVPEIAPKMEFQDFLTVTRTVVVLAVRVQLVVALLIKTVNFQALLSLLIRSTPFLKN
jgi:hypothetical protein